MNGQKVWTSWAHHSDLGLLLTRTSAEPRHRNLTMFLVDMRQPGVTVRPLRQMTGGADFNEVFFDEVRISDANRLGEVGAGWSVALTTLSNERAAVGDAGSARTGVFSTARLIEMVRASGRTGDPRVREEFARLYSGIRLAKLTRQRSEDRRRSGQAPGPEMSTAKLAQVRNLQALSAFVSSLLGAKLIADGGEAGTYAWAELVLGVPGARIGGGTDEVQRNIVAERVLELPR